MTGIGHCPIEGASVASDATAHRCLSEDNKPPSSMHDLAMFKHGVGYFASINGYRTRHAVPHASAVIHVQYLVHVSLGQHIEDGLVH
jgi:hypothetical protein